MEGGEPAIRVNWREFEYVNEARWSLASWIVCGRLELEPSTVGPGQMTKSVPKVVAFNKILPPKTQRKKSFCTTLEPTTRMPFGWTDTELPELGVTDVMIGRGSEDVVEPPEVDVEVDPEVDELEVEELDEPEVDELDELVELDELDEVDELEELDELDELDELEGTSVVPVEPVEPVDPVVPVEPVLPVVPEAVVPVEPEVPVVIRIKLSRAASVISEIQKRSGS